MIYNKVYELIGNTPIVKINDLFEDLHSDIYLKLEWYNPGGSIKDQLSIDYCNENKVAMVFTKTRHFKH